MPVKTIQEKWKILKDLATSKGIGISDHKELFKSIDKILTEALDEIVYKEETIKELQDIIDDFSTVSKKDLDEIERLEELVYCNSLDKTTWKEAWKILHNNKQDITALEQRMKHNLEVQTHYRKDIKGLIARNVELCDRNAVLESDNEKFKKFIRNVIHVEAWGIDPEELDGGNIQDTAVKLGILKPHIVKKGDEYSDNCEWDIGDEIFVFTDMVALAPVAVLTKRLAEANQVMDLENENRALRDYQEELNIDKAILATMLRDAEKTIKELVDKLYKAADKMKVECDSDVLFRTSCYQEKSNFTKPLLLRLAHYNDLGLDDAKDTASPKEVE